MLPDIRKILYATDLSPNARRAFGYAASLANRYGAGLVVLHVLNDAAVSSDSLIISMVGEQKWNDLKRNNTEAAMRMIRERVESFCEEAEAEMPACPFITDAILVKLGHPVEEILKAVRENDCDLVVMGAHGNGFLADATMGGVSRRVLRRCDKPVLIVRLPEGETPGE